MIGNVDDARRAFAGSMPVFSKAGSSRIVFRDADSPVVYKVEMYPDNLYSANTSEFENITNFDGELPEGVNLPMVSLYHIVGKPVIAMEYIEGQAMAECYCLDSEPHDATCMPNDIMDKVCDILDDTGGLNVIVNDQGAWIIDLA